MLGDEEDVFESVAWETPSAGYHAQQTEVDDDPVPSTSSGPGYRQSTDPDASERGPHVPKWEGFLITSVQDPVKELPDTKDAYVSYLVSAKVTFIDYCIVHELTSNRLTFLFLHRRTHQLEDASRTLCS